MSKELSEKTVQSILHLLDQGKSVSLIASMMNLPYSKVLEVKKAHYSK